MLKILILLLGTFLMIPGRPLSSQSLPVVKLHAFEFNDGHQDYYFALLDKALAERGYTMELIPHRNVPQRRIEYILDNDEQPFIHFFLQTDERDERWKTIPVGLTESLIGHRVFFIPRGKQSLYSKVETLEDFRDLDLTGGFGAGWFDVSIWKANDLKYYPKEGEWRTIYSMVSAGDRGVDYFSRGVTEILGESRLLPRLDIEQNLLFVYDRDFRFYMTDSAHELFGEILTDALSHANESGLISRLIREFWADDFERLQIDERIRIPLDSPKF